MSRADFTDAPRVLTSLLAPLEKRTLLWLAERLPAAIHSDHLTLLALVAMLLAGLAFGVARWYPPALLLVVVCLALNWFGDSLDGTVARVRNAQRPRYGFYVDHVVDAVGILFLVGGMGVSGYMTPWVAMAFLIAYFLLVIEVYLATYCVGHFQMTFWRLGATELRILAAAGTIALLFKPTTVILGRSWLLLDVSGVIATLGLFATFAVSVARNTATLYRLEPRPLHSSRSTTYGSTRVARRAGM